MSGCHNGIVSMSLWISGNLNDRHLSTRSGLVRRNRRQIIPFPLYF
ncbi:uncharacterized protein HMPREF1541_01957 [Cyphellophora europaea CBS 101466]|uniref:Uncharacterized protein n=1 Tax=Cyphellophora europaea (strain CBS 101466) TaxID=1220924 RepID=W2S4A3_CYPE1|nr:uncharacterized protein HMPREF1541_01957 [Cyphellophora europaea CBS 101466]ETN42799.1 hypothetical protein HMPREF1541_01957 [Cyphellophora europaea CBS 101466]